jgi:hypothetical protein
MNQNPTDQRLEEIRHRNHRDGDATEDVFWLIHQLEDSHSRESELKAEVAKIIVTSERKEVDGRELYQVLVTKEMMKRLEALADIDSLLQPK